MHLRQKLLTDRQPILPFRCFFVKSWIYFGAQASCLRFCSRQCHHCTVFIIIITINSDRSSWRYDGRYDQCNATNEMHLIHTIKTNKQTMQLLFPENITSDDDNNATSMKSISNHVSAANLCKAFHWMCFNRMQQMQWRSQYQNIIMFQLTLDLTWLTQ